MTRKSADPATYRVQVLERAVDILQVLSEDSRELAAGEVAERLSLHKSTIHRLLAVLDHHRLIRKNADTGSYALGLRLFEFGTRAVRGLRLRDQAQPHLEQLASETGETAHICVYDNGEMVSLAYAEGPRSLRMPATVGGRTPAYCSAVGKAMLAFLPDAARGRGHVTVGARVRRRHWSPGRPSRRTCVRFRSAGMPSITRRSKKACVASAARCGTTRARSSRRSVSPGRRSASPRAGSGRSRAR